MFKNSWFMTMIFNTISDIKNDRTCKSLTGISIEQFKALSAVFESSYHEIQNNRVAEGDIKRLRRGGKAPHFTNEQKLFFVLYYKKNYPTFDTLGYLFNLSSGNAYEHMTLLLPCLEHSLAQLDMLPFRHFNTKEEMIYALEGVDKVAIDGMERACQRPQNDTLQKARYSGKKNAIQ
jgi:hypothetical protein